MIRGVTGILVIANIGIFLVLTLLGNGALFETLALHRGAFWSGAFWQPLTSMFLHGGIGHLLFNMIALWSLGTPIERTVGRNKFIGLYFISGLAGSLLVVIFQAGNIATVGASGAILGLLGAMAIFYPNATVLLFFVIPMRVRTLAIIFGIGSVILAFSNWAPGISHLGHLGGLIGGFLYARFAIAKGNNSMHAGGPGGIFGGGAPGGYGGSNPRDMRETLRDFMRDPRSHMNRAGGGFVHPGQGQPTDSGRSNYPDVDDGGFRQRPRRGGDTEVDIERPKKLYFDQESGQFYFK